MPGVSQVAQAECAPLSHDFSGGEFPAISRRELPSPSRPRTDCGRGQNPLGTICAKLPAVAISSLAQPETHRSHIPVKCKPSMFTSPRGWKTTRGATFWFAKRRRLHGRGKEYSRCRAIDRPRRIHRREPPRRLSRSVAGIRLELWEHWLLCSVPLGCMAGCLAA